MITAGQMRAARALLGIDQREMARRSGLSLPTIQRMESSNGVVRGNVDSLMKLVDALATHGIELIGEGGCVRHRRPRSAAQMTVTYALYGVAALLALGPLAIALAASPRGTSIVYSASLIVTLALGTIALHLSRRSRAGVGRHPAARAALARRAFPHRCAVGVLSRRRQSRRRGGEPVRARLWPPRNVASARAAVLSGLSRRHESGRHGGRRLQLPGVVGIHVAHLVGAGGLASPACARICAPATSIC